MIIGIDIDGVVADFCYGFTSVAKDLGLVPAPWPSILQDNWKFDFDVHPVWDAIDTRMNWWMTLPSLIDEEEALLLSTKDVVFITNRNPDKGFGLPVDVQTELWLCGLGVTDGIVYCTNDKVATAQEIGVDIMLEDKPENIHKLTAAGIDTVCRRWGYNTELPAVYSVKEFFYTYVRPAVQA